MLEEMEETTVIVVVIADKKEIKIKYYNNVTIILSFDYIELDIVVFL